MPTEFAIAAWNRRTIDPLAEEMAKALECIQQRWTFNNSQQHTHSWHDWADCQPMITAALASYRANQTKP